MLWQLPNAIQQLLHTPYGLIASVPALDLRIIHNDKELNDCLAQHSAMLKKIRIRHNPKLEHDPYNGYLKLKKLKRNRKPKQP